MGVAEALRRTGRDQVTAPKRALGASERRRAPTVTALAQRARAATGEERRSLVAEVVREELAAVITLGATEAQEVVECLARGRYEEAAFRMIEAGVAHQHAWEIIEHIGPAEAHAATPGALGVAGATIAFSLLEAKLALAAIRQEHSDGDRIAAEQNYAEAWSHTIVDAVLGDGVTRPQPANLAHLDEARHRGYRDAMALLRTLDGGSAKALAAAMRDELGTPSNAYRALVTALVEDGGRRGLVFHERGVR